MPKRKEFMYMARPFFSLISSTLIPNTKILAVYLNRVALLYVICSRMPLDVGNIINANIRMCRFDPTVGSLWFPSTITWLAREVG